MVMGRLELYLDRRVAYGRASDDTKRSYRTGARKFVEWCAARGLAVGDVVEDDVVDYRAALKQYAQSTVRSRLQAVRVLLDALGMDPNPAANVHARPDRTAATEVIEYLTVEQVQAVLAQARAEVDQVRRARGVAMVWLLVTTGIRNRELCDLNVSDLTLETGRLIVRSGKGGKRRVLHLAPKTIVAMRDWLAIRPPGGPLFVGTTGKGRLTPGGVRKIVNSYLVGAETKVRGRAVHLFRHTALTLATWAGATREHVQRMAGHADPRTTDRYVHLVDAQRGNPGLFVEGLL